MAVEGEMRFLTSCAALCDRFAPVEDVEAVRLAQLELPVYGEDVEET